MSIVSQVNEDYRGVDVVVSNVNVEYGGGSVVLRDINVTLDAGQLVCVLGRSGCGKSTLLRALAGLVPVSEGTITTGGKAVTGPGSDRAMVFQEDCVFPWMRAAANVRFALHCNGVKGNVATSRAQKALEEVGLGKFARAWPAQLSGGMRSRVAVASVFAVSPAVLLADEPFGALDYITRRSMQELLLASWTKTRPTVVFVTHDVDEALVLADRVLVVDEGSVRSDHSVNLARPRTEDVLSSGEAVALKKMLLDELHVTSA